MPTTSQTTSLIKMLITADFMVQIVVLVLILMSIWSWSIIINKYLAYKKLKKEFSLFEEKLWSQDINELYMELKNDAHTIMEVIFVKVIGELKRQTVKKDYYSQNNLKIKIASIINALKIKEFQKIEDKLSVIATLGSNAPFIGLFGMVWSIMNCFYNISFSKNVNLSALAPSISEALFVTALGLLVAVPALVMYNILVIKSNLLIQRIENFENEFFILISNVIEEGDYVSY